MLFPCIYIYVLSPQITLDLHMRSTHRLPEFHHFAGFAGQNLGPELDFRGGTGHQDLLRRVGGDDLWLLMLDYDGFLVEYYANMPGC